jgi:Type IV pili methyl-accepting chemotaxis transducer N-term/Methyl-accepting chemotaxis protein (MCP) signalling domain
LQNDGCAKLLLQPFGWNKTCFTLNEYANLAHNHIPIRTSIKGWLVQAALNDLTWQDGLSNQSDRAAITSAKFGAMINLAGRQRMLSQRVAMSLLLYARGNTSALTNAQDALQLFRESHTVLLHGNAEMPGAFCETLRQIYYGQVEADTKITQYIELATDAVNACKANFRTAPGLLDALGLRAVSIVDLLNRITLIYEDESKLFAKNAHRLHLDLMEDIQTIAMQAKIVSVNAQIAAARAGGAGREFAVVAYELTHITQEIDKLVGVAMSSLHVE